MTHILVRGDARRIPLPDASVHCVITSPPYFGLRSYLSDGHDLKHAEIGLEPTPEAYVAAMVAVFREVKRCLRDDGTVWINLGDSMGGTIRSDLADCLAARVKGRVLLCGARCSLTVTTHRQDVLGSDQRTPDRKFTTLLGAKRIFLKQGDDDLREVVDLLHPESRLRIGPTIRFRRGISQSSIEILLDAENHTDIVVTEHDLDADSPLGVTARSHATEDGKTSLAVEESGEPVAKGVRHAETVRDTLAFDPGGECGLDVDPVNEPIPLADALVPRADILTDFGVTSSSLQHLNLTGCNGRVNLAFRGVRHLFVSNEFGSLVRHAELYDQAKRKSNTLRSKQELGIPFLMRQALMEDGWICRQTIIWAKPNPMPESVTDRPTKSHEYLFLLSKRERYWYDAESVREKGAGARDQVYLNTKTYRDGRYHRNGLSGSTLGSAESIRNMRSVLNIPTEPYPGSHFATYPRKLVEPCIKAGTSEKGCCPACGEPWRREIETIGYDAQRWAPGEDQYHTQSKGRHGRTSSFTTGLVAVKSTRGWNPSCACDAGEPVSCTVLDPFNGSGTTGVVATALGRRFVGLDLSAEYLRLAARRIERPHARVERSPRVEFHPLFDGIGS